jgi:hypothetical protein
VYACYFVLNIPFYKGDSAKIHSIASSLAMFKVCVALPDRVYIWGVTVMARNMKVVLLPPLVMLFQMLANLLLLMVE